MTDEERERRIEDAVAWLAEMSAKYQPRYRTFEEAEVALRELVRKARRERIRKRRGKKDGSDPDGV